MYICFIFLEFIWLKGPARINDLFALALLVLVTFYK